MLKHAFSGQNTQQSSKGKIQSKGKSPKQKKFRITWTKKKREMGCTNITENSKKQDSFQGLLINNNFGCWIILVWYDYFFVYYCLFTLSCHNIAGCMMKLLELSSRQVKMTEKRWIWPCKITWTYSIFQLKKCFSFSADHK